jgi:molybdopterin converting factor small subunit
MATISIPTVLRPHVEGQREVRLNGATVDEVLGELTTRYPALRPQLYGPNGSLRSFVNVFLNDDNVRFLQKGATPVAEGDTLSIVPAVAGG